MSLFNILAFLLGGSIAHAQDSSNATQQIKKSKESFNELSDITRNVSDKLEEASKKGDEERVQCISSRKASISALLDISQQAQSSIQSSLEKQDFMRIDSESRKITIALRKAKQYQAEVESCLSSQASSSSGDSKTIIQVDTTAVGDLLVGDEASFGMDTVNNQVRDLDSQTSTSSGSTTSSEDTPPPPPTSPFE